MNLDTHGPGRLVKAPENFLDTADVRRVMSGRRDFLRQAFVAAGTTGAAAVLSSKVQAATAVSGQGDSNILELPAHTKGLGQPVVTDGYGKPSQFEINVQRRQSPGLTQTTQSSVSFAPLQSMFGIVTPSGLHFERHHQGWWDVDPSKHRLMVNGSDPSLLKAARVFTMDELMRLPSVSRFHFIECGANTGMEWGNVAVPTCQYTHGMLSCSEFTGVPLRIVLDMCGVDLRRARFVLAEVEVGDKPYASKDETIHYVDLMPDGRHRQYTSIQECKSVITTPSGGQVLLDKGFYSISGLAWSGRGKVKRVDVSVDGGRNWRTAQLGSPVMSKCLTRFSLDWVWDGKPVLLQSRAIDETGYVQPNYKQLRAVRGTRSIYHNNAVQTWLVQESGEVKNVQLS